MATRLTLGTSLPVVAVGIVASVIYTLCVHTGCDYREEKKIQCGYELHVKLLFTVVQ
jgi:hypothetical protein